MGPFGTGRMGGKVSERQSAGVDAGQRAVGGGPHGSSGSPAVWGWEQETQAWSKAHL